MKNNNKESNFALNEDCILFSEKEKEEVFEKLLKRF